MDKRDSRRHRIRVLAKIDQHSAILHNVSNRGLQLLTNRRPEQSRVEVEFHNEGDPITLSARVRWIRKRFSGTHSLEIGCRVVDAPPEYYRFVDTRAEKLGLRSS